MAVTYSIDATWPPTGGKVGPSFAASGTASQTNAGNRENLSSAYTVKCTFDDGAGHAYTGQGSFASGTSNWSVTIPDTGYAFVGAGYTLTAELWVSNKHVATDSETDIEVLPRGPRLDPVLVGGGGGGGGG